MTIIRLSTNPGRRVSIDTDSIESVKDHNIHTTIRTKSGDVIYVIEPYEEVAALFDRPSLGRNDPRNVT